MLNSRSEHHVYYDSVLTKIKSVFISLHAKSVQSLEATPN